MFISDRIRPKVSDPQIRNTGTMILMNMANWNYVVPQPTPTVFSGTKYKNSPIGSLHGLANLIIATVQVVLACGGLAARL